MQIALKVRSNPIELNNRLLMAIHKNDIRMARFLSYYLKGWPLQDGETALELAIKYSGHYGIEMTKTYSVFPEQNVQMAL